MDLKFRIVSGELQENGALLISKEDLEKIGIKKGDDFKIISTKDCIMIISTVEYGEKN